jgi:hypothetical protein
MGFSLRFHRTAGSLAALCCIALLVAGCGSSSKHSAAPSPSATGSKRPTLATGVVSAVTPSSVTIKEKGGTTQTFHFSLKVNVKVGGQPSSVSALKVGDRVTLFGSDSSVRRIVDRGPPGTHRSGTASPAATA